MKRYIRSSTLTGIDKIRDLARDETTAPDILAQLARHEHVAVRQMVAQNPGTPADVLSKLANDYYPDVRRSVADNPNTPVEVLEDLAAHDWGRVKRAAKASLQRRGHYMI